MRKFYLENKIGQRIDLNAAPYYFLNPQGLGIAFENTVAAIGNGFYKKTNSASPAGGVTGEIAIVEGGGKNPYENYTALADWLMQGIDLSLVYLPHGTTEFYSDIDINYINKSEYTDTGYLSCVTSVICKTPWYKHTAKTLIITPGGGDSVSRFDMRFNFAFADSISGTVPINCSGHLPSAIRLTSNSALTNPRVELLDGSEVVSRMLLSDTAITAGQDFEYSSLYLSPGVWVDGVSKIDALDLANENFFRIPPGREYRLRLASDAASDVSATIYLYDYYRSV